jgi:Domain of unknown function (DUF5666)
MIDSVFAWRRLSAFCGMCCVLWVAAWLPGCGGGVGEGGTGSFGDAGGFTSGPITGFGSVIVNNVRYDDSVATVQDGDGSNRSSSDLRLGMTVEINSSIVTVGSSTNTAKASAIRYDSELLGAVLSISASTSTFTVLGQTVLTDAATVFDSSVGSLVSLKVGAFVEVFAVFDPATLRYRATRVGPAGSGTTPHLRGLVAQVDSATQTLKITNTFYTYAGAAGMPADLAAGQFVRLRVAAGAPVNSRYTVLGFGTALRPLPDSTEASVQGRISAFTSISSFNVNGRSVDASGATFPNGSAGLKVGARVNVEGSARNGILLAKKVSFEDDSQGGNQTFELHGPITAVDTLAKTIVVRGLTISTARPDLKYDNGTVANLVVGRSVEVKGKLSADGLRIEATSINFE